MIDTTRYTKLLVLKRHWALAVTVGLIVLAVTIPVALGLPDLYRATAKLTIERRSTQPSIVSPETRLLMIKQDALSRGNLTELIEKLNLYPELREKTSIETVIDRVENDIVVTPFLVPAGNGMQSTLSFTVSYRGETPESSAAAANALASFYVAQNDVLRSRQASRAVQELEGQVKEAKAKWTDASDKMTEFLAKNRSNLPEQFSIKSQLLVRVTNELTQKTTRQQLLDSQVGSLRREIATDALRVVPGGAGLTDEQQRSDAMRTLANLMETGATEAHPDVQVLRKRIAGLDEKIKSKAATPSVETATLSPAEVNNKLLADTLKELEGVRLDVQKLEKQSQSLSAELSVMPGRSPELEGLNADVQIARASYDSLKKSYDAAFFAEQSEQSQESEEFRISDRARPPHTPAGPNRMNLIVGGFIFAIALGLGAAIARDQLDTSFHTIDELRTFTQVPILASIPKITTAPQRVRRTVTVIVAATSLVAGLAVVSVGAFHFAQRHVGIARLVTK